MEIFGNPCPTRLPYLRTILLLVGFSSDVDMFVHQTWKILFDVRVNVVHIDVLVTVFSRIFTPPNKCWTHFAAKLLTGKNHGIIYDRIYETFPTRLWLQFSGHADSNGHRQRIIQSYIYASRKNHEWFHTESIETSVCTS